MEGIAHGWMWLWWTLVVVFLITGTAAFIKYLMK